MSAPTEKMLKDVVRLTTMRDFWLSLERVLLDDAHAALAGGEEQRAVDLRWQAERIRHILLDTPQTQRLTVRWRPPEPR
jgi:hypothetical protein